MAEQTQFEDAMMQRSTAAENLREELEKLKEAISGADPENVGDYHRGILHQMKWQNKSQRLGIKAAEWPK